MVSALAMIGIMFTFVSSFFMHTKSIDFKPWPAIVQWTWFYYDLQNGSGTECTEVKTTNRNLVDSTLILKSFFCCCGVSSVGFIYSDVMYKVVSSHEQTSNLIKCFKNKLHYSLYPFLNITLDRAVLVVIVYIGRICILGVPTFLGGVKGQAIMKH